VSQSAGVAARLLAASEVERSLQAASSHVDEARWMMEQDDLGGLPDLTSLVSEAWEAVGRALAEAQAVRRRERRSAGETRPR
jgi:hypothetical protein